MRARARARPRARLRRRAHSLKTLPATCERECSLLVLFLFLFQWLRGRLLARALSERFYARIPTYTHVRAHTRNKHARHDSRPTLERCAGNPPSIPPSHVAPCHASLLGAVLIASLCLSVAGQGKGERARRRCRGVVPAVASAT